MSAEWVTAEWVTAITAIVTVILISVQYFREKSRKLLENTVDLLSEYERDPIIYDVQFNLNRIVRETDRDLSKLEDTGELKFYSSKILNYYEGIAHRYYAKTVDKETVEKQYGHLVIRDVDVLVNNKKAGGITPPKKAMFTTEQAEEALPNLMALYRKLKPKQQGENTASTT